MAAGGRGRAGHPTQRPVGLLRALATWALFAASATGLFAGLVWWSSLLIRIGVDNDDVRTWPSAVALPLLCMLATPAALYALLMLGIGRGVRDENPRDANDTECAEQALRNRTARGMDRPGSSARWRGLRSLRSGVNEVE